MTRETKVGLMMVALLVGVFGFLIYQRIHRPSEGLAGQEPSGIRAESDRRKSDPHVQPNSFSFEEEDLPRQRRPSAAELMENDGLRGTPHEPDDDTESLPAFRRKQTTEAEEDDGFAQFAERTPAAKTPRLEPPLESTSDPFEDFEGKRNSPRIVAQVAEADPFSSDAEESEVSEESDMDEQDLTINPTRPQAKLALPAEADETSFTDEQTFDPEDEAEKPVNDDSRQSDSLNVADEGEEPDFEAPLQSRSRRSNRVQQAGEFDTDVDPPATDERRPAPMTFNEPGFSPEPMTRSLPALKGANYVIQPNDNFWAISRKRYGVGRYYMALARHNQQAIPDPKRMKPGVEISTPDIAYLEQHYGELIPRPAPAEPATAISSTASSKSEETDPSGFFVSAEGVPMYRVVGHDTLSEIAKSHLGRSSRWVQILEMNRSVLRDGNELKIGTVLRLPADASRVQVVGTPRDYR